MNVTQAANPNFTFAGHTPVISSYCPWEYLRADSPVWRWSTSMISPINSFFGSSYASANISKLFAALPSADTKPAAAAPAASSTVSLNQSDLTSIRKAAAASSATIQAILQAAEANANGPQVSLDAAVSAYTENGPDQAAEATPVASSSQTDPRMAKYISDFYDPKGGTALMIKAIGSGELHYASPEVNARMVSAYENKSFVFTEASNLAGLNFEDKTTYIYDSTNQKIGMTASLLVNYHLVDKLMAQGSIIGNTPGSGLGVVAMLSGGNGANF